MNNKMTTLRIWRVVRVNSSAFAMLLVRHQKSVRAVAKHLHIPKRTVKGWCRGIGMPNTWQAIKVAKLLGCDLVELYLAVIRTVRMGG